MTYEDWLKRHAAFFGFQSEAELVMLASWCGHFERAGFTPEELAEATAFLANDPPRYRADHLAALQDRIRNQRGREIRRQGVEEDRGRCALGCGNGGLIVVPHLKTHRGETGGRWYTMAVLCTCVAGRALAAKSDADWLRLDAYQQEVPDWRDIMRQHDADLKRADQAAVEAAELRKQASLMDAILGRLKARVTA